MPAGKSATRKIKHNAPPSVQNYLNTIKARYEEQHARNAIWTNATKEQTLKGFLETDQKLFDDLTTLENVNRIIERLYDLDGTTKPLRKLEGFGEAAADWDIMDSSANNNDCLIHSILTATCSNFRKLKKADKDEFANFFRRTIFLTLPVVLCYQEHEAGHIFQEVVDRIKSSSFLEDIELFLLAAQFKFRVLGASKYEDTNQFQYVNAIGIRGTIPSECCAEDDSQWPIICLYTNDAHFESVRVGGQDYELTEDQVNTAIESLERNTNGKQWDCGACTLKNPPKSIECGACASAKPVASASVKPPPKKFKVKKPAPITTVKKFTVKKGGARSGARVTTHRLRCRRSI
jgi:hypothetical protein